MIWLDRLGWEFSIRDLLFNYNAGGEIVGEKYCRGREGRGGWGSIGRLLHPY